jgi:methylglyoxal/glyoxal reductase
MKTLSGKPISKIGIGSYGVGGRGHRDMVITEKQADDIYVDALTYTLERDVNFIELSLGYGHGQSLALFKQAFDRSLIDRKDIFITHSFYPRDLQSLEVIHQDIGLFYHVMETDYADSTLVTQSLLLKFKEEQIYPLLHTLLETGSTRYVSLSNASPEWIKRFKQEFGDKFYAHEGHLSFEVRALQDKGVFGVCNDLHVENIIWRPLRRNNTIAHNWDILVDLASKYNKTQNQIILNWMCKLGYRPMVMSTSKKHIDENIEATNFVMSDVDCRRLTDFRVPNYHPPGIDWEGARIDDDIVRLVNEFERHIDMPRTKK